MHERQNRTRPEIHPESSTLPRQPIVEETTRTLRNLGAILALAHCGRITPAASRGHKGYLNRSADPSRGSDEIPAFAPSELAAWCASIFSRMPRPEIVHHRHVAGPSLRHLQ